MCHASRMAITPLYTDAELNELITAYKKALLDLAQGKRVRFSSAGSDHEFEPQDIESVQKALDYFQSQKAKNAGLAGPQFLSVRPRR